MYNEKLNMSFRIRPQSVRNLFRFFRFLPSVEMTVLLTLNLFLLMKFDSYSQSTTWFPSDLNIQPFNANFLEPKAGFLISTDNNKLRLDISTSRDIIQWSNVSSTFSIGADVFTFTRLRSTDEFKFPVETIDYLFGINAGFKKQVCNENEIGFRFRLSHVSTHLVDGQYDAQTQKWREGRDPFVYSKEFIELFPYYRYKTLRAYLGFTYIFHIIPEELKKINLQFGFDYFMTEFGTELFTPFFAYDFKLNGEKKFIGNNIISAGVKFGNWKSGGLSIYYSYIAGNSLHGQLYDLRENYSNIGFNFEL